MFIIIAVFEPTNHAQCQELVIDRITFKTHDLGGHAAARRLWKEYFVKVDGVVFIVDVADPQRFQEASQELNRLLDEDLLKDVPFLILGNKIDAKGAVDEGTLKQALNINDVCTGKNKGEKDQGRRPLEVHMCSVVKRVGYDKGFKWLSQYLA